MQVGSALGNTHRNAPHVIQAFYVGVGLLSILMTTAFVDSAASRDFATGSSALLFSKPIKRRDYLVGRFIGAVLIALIPSLGVSLGILAAGISPWVVPERWGLCFGQRIGNPYFLCSAQYTVFRFDHLCNLGDHPQYPVQFHWNDSTAG